MGYRDLVVQDLHIQPHNTCDRLELWQAASGSSARCRGDLNGGHFGPQLRR
jgi:hypothetical protein